MTFNDLARKRYSCRKLAAKPVEQEKIDAIVEAGILAPTAVNKQPFRIWAASAGKLKNARKDELERQMREVEIQQTENLSDQQVVDLVENAIRSRPEDFPLLTKYYRNAQS